MKNIMISLCPIFFSTIVTAALPPYYHRANEIKAILANSDVVNKLGVSSMVSTITRNESSYTLTTEKCSLEVYVTYVSPPVPGFAGPGQIEVRSGEPTCLPE